MKEKQNPTPDKSFSAAIEQMAQLLRSEVKLKDRKTKVIPASSLSTSLNNVVQQVAKMLRTQVHSAKPSKKRIWKKPKKLRTD